jgi:sarcosine oxidase
MWRELEAESGRALLTECGVLTIFPAAETGRDRATVSMANVLASVDEHGIAAEVLNAEALAARFPQHHLDGGELGLLDLEGGLVRPEFAVIAANRRARELGARLLERTDVLTLEPGDGHVVVRSSAGRFTVRQVVVCEGPWGGALLPSLAGSVQPRRIVMTWFDALDPTRFTPDVFPVFAREVSDRAFFGVPTLDGGSVKVATLAEERDTSPDALDRDVSVAEAERIAESVARYLPGLHPYPHRTAVQMDGFTADTHPVVGAVPGFDGVWVLTGFSGHGFKMAPAMGRVAADLVRDGGTDLPIDTFDPRRFATAVTGERSTTPA